MDINVLEQLVKFDNITSTLSPDSYIPLSDTEILKSFSLSPLTANEDVYEKSLLSRLLNNRSDRPSSETWDAFMTFAKSADKLPADAAELYFMIKDQQVVRAGSDDSVDTPDNMIGDAPMEGFGLMQKEGEDKEKCG